MYALGKPQLPPWVIDPHLVGGGGQSTVYRCKISDKGDTSYACKLYIGLTHYEQTRGREEARILKHLGSKPAHHAWPRYYIDGDTPSGQFAIVYEWVDGRAIVDFANHERLGVADRLRLGAALCESVETWHNANLRHRDLKPSNTIARRDPANPLGFTVTLIDAGLAEMAGAGSIDAAVSTMTNWAGGTFGYRHRDRLELGTAASADRDDLFAVGAILYELLTGRPLVHFDDPPRPPEGLDEIASRHWLEKLFWKQQDHPRPSALLTIPPHSRAPAHPLPSLGLDTPHQQVQQDLLVRCLAGVGDAVLLKATHEKSAWLYRSPLHLRKDLEAIAAWLDRGADTRRLDDLQLHALHSPPPGVAAKRKAAQPPATFSPRSDRSWLNDPAAWRHEEHVRLIRLHAGLTRGAAGLIAQGEYATAADVLRNIDPSLHNTWEARYLRARAEPHMLFLQHERWVRAAAFSPDDTRIVTGSDDGSVRVWSARSGEQILAFTGHTGAVHSAKFSPDGSRIVTAGADGLTVLWNARSGEQILVLTRHSRAVYSVAFSPDGSRIVTAGTDCSASVWDACSGVEILVLTGHEHGILSAAFSPNGERIVTAGEDRFTRVWDAQMGGQLLVLIGHEHRVSSAAFSADGTRIVTASDDGSARVWGAHSGEQTLALVGHKGGVYFAEFSHDGERIVTAGDDRLARVWDAHSGRQIFALMGHKGAVYSAAFGRDDGCIVTASGDWSARVWDARSGKQVIVLNGHEGAVRSVAFSSDGASIVTASNDGSSRVWDARLGQQMFVLTHKGAVRSAAFSPDGARIVTASDDGSAQVWDACSGERLLILTGHIGAVRSAVLSPDGARIVTASDDGSARVWDARSRKQVLALTGHSGPVHSAAFSPNGEHILTAGTDSFVRMWDARSGQQIVALIGHGHPVFSAVFSADGARIVTASDDGSARVWDARSGEQVLALVGHGGSVSSAAFSPDSARIVTAGGDGSARVWDARSGEQVLALTGHAGWLTSAAFSLDGTRIATAGSDGTARVWDARSPQERYELSLQANAAANLQLAEREATPHAQVWIDSHSARGLNAQSLRAAAAHDPMLSPPLRRAIHRLLGGDDPSAPTA